MKPIHSCMVSTCFLSSRKMGWKRGDREETHEHTTIQFPCSKNDHPIINPPIFLRNPVTDPKCQRPRAQHSQQLQTHNREIRACPSLIRLRINHPQFAGPIIRILRSIYISARSQEIGNRNWMSNR